MHSATRGAGRPRIHSQGPRLAAYRADGVGVARMNWAKASAEYRSAKGYDYSARMDDEEQVPLGLLERGPLKPDPDEVRGSTELSKRSKKNKKKKKATPQPEVRKKQSTPSEGRPEIIKASRRTRARGSRGTSIAETIKLEAMRSGRTVAEVAAARMPDASPRPTSPASTPRASAITSSGKSKVPRRPAPPPQAAPSSRRAVQPAQIGGPKRQRDAAEANRRGLSVEQLKAERRRVAEEDLALHEEAVRLGISVKQLRKQLADDTTGGQG